MAITPLTGFKAFTFDGEKSTDYGVAILGEGVFNAPERDVEMITIPGRNGTFALDNGRFENIEVTYPANLIASSEADFREALSDFRNMLCSRKGYVRLQDDYHPNEYRMAVYKEGLDVDEKVLRAGEFKITFDCKPQRWLTSGEELVTVGEYAEPVGTDNAPYLFRSSPQFSDGYDTEMEKLVGGTVAWNQLVPITASSVTGVVNNGDGSFSVSSGINTYYVLTSAFNAVMGHKYLAILDGGVSGKCYVRIEKLSGNPISTQVNYIFNVTETLKSNIWVRVYNPEQNLRIIPQVFDLTQMFGSTIADYIYTLESGTAGAGVAKLKSWGFLTKPYYAYDSGSLISVKTSAHTMTGFNQWDEEWELGGYANNTGDVWATTDRIRSKSTNYIPVVSGATYYNRCSATINYYFYDSDKRYISYEAVALNHTFTIPNNAKFMRFFVHPSYGTTYNNDICINISKTTGTPKNGEYEPYEEHSYPLDSDLELRGIPKLDNGNLYYDGDVYESNGTVTRKYGVVDLGTLTWTLRSTGTNHKGWSASLPSQYLTTSDSAPTLNWIASNYAYVGGTSGSAIATNGADSYGIGVYHYNTTNGTPQTNCYVITDVNSSPNGQLCYELATPTTETADAFESIQTVSPLGTEEYTDTRTVPIPVGHDTKYGMNPDVITNPTLFESSPLLEVYGYGTVSFNNYDIEVLSAELGEIKITDTENFSSGISSNTKTITLDTSNLVSGDSIYVIGSGMIQGSVRSTDGTYFKHPSVTSTSGVISTNVVQAHDFVRFQINPDFSTGFVYGTASTITCSATFQYYKENSHTTETISTSYAYDGDSTLTITVTRTGVLMQNTKRASETCTMPALYGNSSKIVVPAPVYIDCDLGEAYGYESGELVSYNNIVSIPADLPKLASGANPITYDNTITELKIKPHWWKV